MVATETVQQPRSGISHFDRLCQIYEANAKGSFDPDFDHVFVGSMLRQAKIFKIEKSSPSTDSVGWNFDSMPLRNGLPTLQMFVTAGRSLARKCGRNSP